MRKRKRIPDVWDKLVTHDRLAILDGVITTRFDHVELNSVKKIIIPDSHFQSDRQHVRIFDLEELKKVGIHVYLTSQEVFWIYWHHVRIGKNSCPPTPYCIDEYLENALKKGAIADLPTKEYKKTRRKLKKLGNF